MYNTGRKSFKADRATLGRGLDGTDKETLTIVYEICGNLGMITAKTDELVKLPWGFNIVF